MFSPGGRSRHCRPQRAAAYAVPVVGNSSPRLYRFIFAAVCGALLAAGHWAAGIVTGIVALLLAFAWQRYGDQHRRDSRDSIF
jgi:hypothetical protein